MNDYNPVCIINIKCTNGTTFLSEILFEEIFEDNPSYNPEQVRSMLTNFGLFNISPSCYITVKLPVGYSTDHGSPHDRGGADAWYDRKRDPHWYPDGTYVGNPIKADGMTPQEIAAYHFGYDTTEESRFIYKTIKQAS